MKDGCGYLQLTEREPICDENCEECTMTIREIDMAYNRQFECNYFSLVGEFPTKEHCKRGCKNCTFWLPIPGN